MSGIGHLSRTGGLKMYSSIKNDSLNASCDYTDPISLSETYSYLLRQIRNLRKEIDPLARVLQNLQEDLDPDFSGPSMNSEITQKIATLQSQQYDFDEEISNIRRQYSHEAKEKLDLELNQYRIELNESRFDLNETNKMIKKAKIDLQQTVKKQNVNMKKYQLSQNQIKQMSTKLSSLRQTGIELTQHCDEFKNAKQSYYDEIEYLSNVLKLIQDKGEKRKTELLKVKISYENRKKNLLAQIELNVKKKNKQQTNLNSNFNTSARRIVKATSRRTVPQIIPGIVKNIHHPPNSGAERTSQQNPFSRRKVPRRNDNFDHINSHPRPALDLSTSTSLIPASVPSSILPPSQPQKKPHRHQKIHFQISDPSVKVVKMHKNDDECNDFISFS